jgi:hypothetical protein
MADQEKPGWAEKKWLAICVILAIFWVLLWVLHSLGLLKPIY